MSINSSETPSETFDKGMDSLQVQPSPDESDENEEQLEDIGMSTYSFKLSQANEGSLLQLVLNKKLSKRLICERWISLYESNAEVALINLMEFILEASGSQYKLDRDLKRPFKYLEILITATAKFGNKSLAYPLTMKTAHKFVENIFMFIEDLISLLKVTSILVDGCFLKILSEFLMVCSNSKVRPFRHTSSLIALKFMTLLNGELRSSVESQAKLKDIWLKMFANIFLERYCDVVEDIRRMCIAECGLWLDKYPNSFVDQHNVKHLCLALQDKCPKVCEASLMSLLKLYQNHELRTVCLLHITKYMMTLLGLTMSSESELAQMAVKLLIKIQISAPQLLDPSMIHVIEQLVFASHRGIAQEAAEVIRIRYKNAKTDKERLMVMVQFFIQSGEQEHAAYFVDALYGRNDMILAWNLMVSMLLQPELLSFQETLVLIEIMTRSVKQAVTGEVPVGRYTKDLECQARPHAKKKITKIMLPYLPTLLNQYSSSSEIVINLLELPQYLLLQSVNILELLDQIKEIMFKQQNMSVLRMGAMTLEHLYDINNKHVSHRHELISTAVFNYSSAANHSKDNPERLLITLRLLAALQARFDLHDWQLNEQILNILQLAAKELNETDETLSLYMSIFYLSLCWQLKRVQEMAINGQDVAEECHGLRNDFKNFQVVNFTLIKNCTDESVACDAFVYVCDLFVLFGDSLRNSCSASIQSLEYKSKISDYELLEEYLDRYVFVGGTKGAALQLLDQAQSCVLQSKRRVLSSYLKLVFHNLMPMMRACVVFQYYEQYHPVFGDIMRATMERSLSMNPTNFGMTVMHTCLLVYKRLRVTYPEYSQAVASPDHGKLLKLANLLSELFYIKPLEVRQGILILHRAGINFAADKGADTASNAAPQDLLYLNVIQQFVPQLLAQDLLDILNFLQFIDQSPLSNRSVEWQPLLAYRSSLEIAIRRSCRRDEIPNYATEKKSSRLNIKLSFIYEERFLR